MGRRSTSLGARLAAGIIVLAACGSADPAGGNDPDPQATESSPLGSDTTASESSDREPPTGLWFLESGTISGETVASIPEQTMSLRFKDDGSIRGWNGCHTFLGTVTFAEPGQIRFEASIADVPCDTDDPGADFQAAEDYVLGLVRSVQAWELVDDTLVLSGSASELIFRR